MDNEEKQIEEMAKSVCHLDRTCDECMTSFECKAMMYAKRFYDAGYRKASEREREIFEEIEKFNRPPLPECAPVYILRKSELDKLKKKYIEVEDV